MDKKQESKLNMYDAVSMYCNGYPAIMATVPAFQNSLTDFISKTNAIRETVQMASDVITGIAMDKNQLQKDLCATAASIAACVFAFASSNNHNTLKEKVNYSLSELLRQKDEMLGPVCTNIYNAAQANIASLAPYGITPASLGDFVSAVSDYIATVPGPRNAMTLRSSHNIALAALFKDADTILKMQMDKTALQFNLSNPDFYTNYKKNRIILNTGTTSTQIKGMVAASGTELPLYGASVQVVGKELTTTTNTRGNFRIKPLQPGTYSIKISKTGYQDQVIDNLLVKLGQATKVNVQMNLSEVS